VVTVVEDFADAATCALGDFACALGGADADVLARDACTLADVAGGVDGVEGDEIAGAFADALGCLSGSLGGALADVARSAADVTAGAARLGLWWGLRLGGGRGGWVLGVNILGREGEGHRKERDEGCGECVAHGWILPFSWMRQQGGWEHVAPGGFAPSNDGFSVLRRFELRSNTHISESRYGAPGRGLLFVDEAGAAGLVYFEVDVDFDAVGDFDERDAAVDAVVFAIEGHGSLDGALAGPLAFDRQFEGFGLGDASYGEVAGDVEGVGAGLHDLGRAKGDQRVLFDVKEVFALEFFVLDAASGADGRRLDLDVEDACGDVRGGEGEGGVPLVEVADQRDGGLDVELNGTVYRGGFEDRDLGVTQCRKHGEGQ